MSSAASVSYDSHVLAQERVVAPASNRFVFRDVVRQALAAAIEAQRHHAMGRARIWLEAFGQGGVDADSSTRTEET